MNALTLKDGKLHIVVIPEDNDDEKYDKYKVVEYGKKLTSAIEKSILVMDQVKAEQLIFRNHFDGNLLFEIKEYRVYPIPGLEFKVTDDQSKCTWCKIDCLQNLKGIPCKAPKVAILVYPEDKTNKNKIMEKSIEFNEINTAIPEGKYLMAALAILTTEGDRTKKTPYEVLEELGVLKDKMYPEDSEK